MKTPPIYQWKANCENRIAEIKEELRDVESQPDSPLRQKKIDRLERELETEYASLEDYKGRIQIYESEF
jgi:hypothetical protein